MLDGVFRHEPGIGCRATRHDDDLVDRPEHVLADVQLVEVETTIEVHATQQRVLHGFGILVNLLVHEGVPAAFFGSGGVPVHGERLGIDRIAVEVRDRHVSAADAHGLVLAKLQRLLRVCDESGDIRAQEVLAIAQSHNERGIMTGAHDNLRLAHIHGKQREGTGEHARDTAEGLEQVGLARLFDHLVGDLAQELRGDLRVGAGAERISFGLQVELELLRVFNNAVVDERYLAVLRNMRVGVDIAGGAVRRPARMPDSHRRVRHGRALDLIDEVAQASRLLAKHHGVHAGGHQCDARGVIPAVFQTLEALQTHFQGLFAGGRRARVSYDSAHVS